MSEPFIGQIQPFGFNFAPRGWAMCNGQLLSISQNTALFSLLGTIYGGDGRTTFGLPDLRGRVSLHFGTGPGLSPATIGERGGAEAVALTSAQLPAHNHPAMAKAAAGNANTAVNNIWSADAGNQSATYSNAATGLAAMNAAAIGNAGGGQAHPNMQPYLVINWCIALVGIYPSRD